MDALGQRHALFSTMQLKGVEFEVVKELFEKDLDFEKIWKSSAEGSYQQFHSQKVFLFSGNPLCIP